MSPPPKVILLDSNAYFRLARSIHPLLAGTFGEEPIFSLYVLAELDDEYLTSSRLRTKFEWVNTDEYKRDRLGKRYEYSGTLRKQVETAFSYLVDYTKQNALNISREDLKALAVGFARGFPIVSDDAGLSDCAQKHGIECWSMVKLLKVMFTAGRIDSAAIKNLLEYLDYDNDLPMPINKLRRLFRYYFGTDCPTLLSPVTSKPASEQIDNHPSLVDLQARSFRSDPASARRASL